MPVCLYTPGCPPNTWDQGHRAQGFIGVCSPKPPNPSETWASAPLDSFGGICAIPALGRQFSGTAYCQGGYSAVGGHVSCTGGGGGTVMASGPVGTNGWQGICCNALPFGGGAINVRCRQD
jgi:hypothetical protein